MGVLVSEPLDKSAGLPLRYLSKPMAGEQFRAEVTNLVGGPCGPSARQANLARHLEYMLELRVALAKHGCGVHVAQAHAVGKVVCRGKPPFALLAEPREVVRVVILVTGKHVEAHEPEEPSCLLLASREKARDLE